MLELFGKETSTIKKIWLTVAVSVLFIVTLPIMLIVLPVAVAIGVCNDLFDKKDKKKSNNTSLFADGDLFNKWTGFFNIQKPESWD